MKGHLVIMAKDPRAGQVKTRLARETGLSAATAFYRHTLSALVARLDRPRQWRTVLAVSPDSAIGSRSLPARTLRWPQGNGDLGRRMQRVIDAPVRGPMVIVGSDIPGITASHIQAAFRALGSHDAVFGPAPDGGYWLVGQKRRPRRLSAFTNVRWSGPHALSDTLNNLAGRKIVHLSLLADIDDAPGLAALGTSRGRRILPRPI
jgi:hypothetical protein